MTDRQMLSCTDAAQLIARHADGVGLDGDVADRLEEHLATCAACQTTLSDQRAVAAILRSRPVDLVSPLFASRLAERLEQTAGWFGIADWRSWTFRLAPVAGALVLAAFLFSDRTTTPVSLEEWAVSTVDSASPATLLWNDDISSESLLERLVIGDDDESGASDVR